MFFEARKVVVVLTKSKRKTVLKVKQQKVLPKNNYRKMKHSNETSGLSRDSLPSFETPSFNSSLP